MTVVDFSEVKRYSQRDLVRLLEKRDRRIEELEGCLEMAVRDMRILMGLID